MHRKHKDICNQYLFDLSYIHSTFIIHILTLYPVKNLVSMI